MKLRYAFILSALIFILHAAPVVAEYYKWIDEKGVTHFSDDISEVPENQREAIDVYKSVKGDAPAEPLKPEEPGITPEELNARKEILDSDYTGLIKRKEALTDQKESLKPEQYNEIAKQLNADIQEYQKQAEEYEALVEKYNIQVMEDSAGEEDPSSATDQEDKLE